MSRACAPDQTTPAPANLALFEPDAALPATARRRSARGPQAPRERRWPEAPPAPAWVLHEPAPDERATEQPAPAPKPSRRRSKVTGQAQAAEAGRSAAMAGSTTSAALLAPARRRISSTSAVPLVHSPDHRPRMQAQVISESCTSLLRVNDAPELPFALSINPYRGCEHGCLACPTPTRAVAASMPSSPPSSASAPAPVAITLYAKSNAADRLRLEMRRPGYRPRPICLGSVADAYQPAERQQRLTRAIVEVLAEAQHPFGLTTRSAGIVRDLDLLVPLAERRLVLVLISLSTLNPLLAERLEPHASPPALRLAALRQLARAGVWVGVNLAPLMPGVNDDEVEALVTAAAQAGAQAVRWQGHAAITGEPLVAPQAVDADWRAEIAERVRAAAETAGLTTALPDLDCSLFQPPRAPLSLAERGHRQKNLF